MAYRFVDEDPPSVPYSEAPLTPDEQAKYAATPRIETAGTATSPKYRFVDEPPQEKPINPTEGNSFFENAKIGVGKGATDLWLGAKQLFFDTAATAEKYGPKPVANPFNLRLPSEHQKDIQAQVDEKRQMDAPIMATGGGKVGNFGAKIVPALALSAVPGGQTLAGSIAGGAVLGAFDPVTSGESRLKNTALGAVGGGVGYGMGKGIGYGVGKIAENAAAKKAQNALINDNIAAAREAGYAIPVSQSNPSSVIANTLDIVAGGRPKMAQAASLKNQPITNQLAAKAVGLPTNTPITKEALEATRTAAFNAGYAPVRAAGEVTPGPAYTAALDAIEAASVGANRSFPGAVKNEIPDLAGKLRVGKFDAADGVDMIRVLREAGDKAYRSGDNALGKANRQAATALEDALENHLSLSGATDALTKFKEARQLMAKTFSVEKALNGETGNVSALKLASQLDKGKPLTGELKSVAKMGKLSPTNVQDMRYATAGASQLEALASAGQAVASRNPLYLGLPMLRAGFRNALLSGPVQNNLVPRANNGLLSNFTPSQINALPGTGAFLGAPTGMVLPGLLNFEYGSQ